MIAIFRFFYWPNDSVSGGFEILPSFFILKKAGDLFIVSLIHADMPGKMIKSTNGIRQPQSANAASPIAVRTPRMTISDRNKPRAVVWIHDLNRPRLPCGAYSAAEVAAPPYSPPSANPCSMRRTIKITGAATPIEA